MDQYLSLTVTIDSLSVMQSANEVNSELDHMDGTVGTWQVVVDMISCELNSQLEQNQEEISGHHTETRNFAAKDSQLYLGTHP